MIYNLNDYGGMIADRARMDPYAYALKAAVGPDSVVVDIGAAAGIHALLACKFGARRVYAIEPNEAIHLARELARANGFADRIDFIQDLSTHVTLPERGDVIVSDLRGVLPLFGAHIPSIVDARQRHLSPGGVLIPKRDTLWAALVETRNLYQELIRPWNLPYGLDMEPAKQIVLNKWSAADTDTIRSKNLLTKPQIWAVLDYASIMNPHVGGSKMTWPAGRSGTAHGWLVWFDAELMAGIGFSNGPEENKITDVYGRGFFPLLEPVSIVEGDNITLALQANLVDGEYIWRWDTRIESQDDRQAIKADFEQTTTFDTPSKIKRITDQLAGYRPTLGQEGQIDLFYLRADQRPYPAKADRPLGPLNVHDLF